ncbi:MAG TPA: PQQ-binding-like beta-propeller repeat protein [Terriglobales bacterium]|nr:PQQ-binding-like beta-propeller repeat protein [Terriglobales bacterium]
MKPVSVLAATLLLGLASVPQANGPRNVNWTQYFADTSGSRFAPLDQINATNFSNLEVAWRFKTDNLGNHPEYKLEGTPLEVDGVVYATAGNRRGVVALDATTGELLWVHGEREGERGAAAPRQLSGRGLSYWAGPNGQGARILYVTPGYFLIALDAKTGQPVPSFGIAGKVDLKATDDQKILPDLTTGEIGWQSAPTVVGDEVLVGSAFKEGFTPSSFRNNRGSARAYDVRNGKKLWQWNTIPVKGAKGYDTWLGGSADYTGNTGIWTEITADPEAGLAYLPVESPTSDFYGGKRPGDNLFSDCIVAVDLKTGKMKWYFQITHHDIWDLDMSSAPLLMDIAVGGKPIKAVAVPTKMGLLYVFDRLTGKPVWPMPETPVPTGKVPGEWYSPTQPIPSKPAAYGRNGFTTDDLIAFTPEIHQKALELAQLYQLGPIYTPPVLSQQPPAGPRATLTVGPASGGTNWPGGSFNPENHTVYVMSCDGCLGAYALVPPPANFTDLPYIEGQVGQHITMVTAAGAGQGADAVAVAPPAERARGARGGGVPSLTVDGLPLVKPPYSTLSAINLDTGMIEWQVAHGDTPDYIRNSPALKGLNVPRTGQRSYNIGTLVTQSLVIAGDAMVTTTPDHPRGAMLRAYDQKTGQEVGGVLMPAPQSGSPMTYMVNGKQYLIVAVSGGNYSGEYICYTLPDSR